ncbi:MAG: zinc ribbon domain-containing protein [Oscillospiraceae bacterium]
MICKNCGTDNAENSSFCSSCGASMNAESAPAPAPAPAPTYVNVQMPSNVSEPISVGGYVGMFILMGIPLVNIICLIVWICSSNKNTKNFGLAYLILIGITVGISIITTIIIFLIGGFAMSATIPEIVEGLLGVLTLI